MNSKQTITAALRKQLDALAAMDIPKARKIEIARELKRKANAMKQAIRQGKNTDDYVRTTSMEPKGNNLGKHQLGFDRQTRASSRLVDRIGQFVVDAFTGKMYDGVTISRVELLKGGDTAGVFMLAGKANPVLFDADSGTWLAECEIEVHSPDQVLEYSDMSSSEFNELSDKMRKNRRATDRKVGNNTTVVPSRPVKEDALIPSGVATSNVIYSNAWTKVVK